MTSTNSPSPRPLLVVLAEHVDKTRAARTAADLSVASNADLEHLMDGLAEGAFALGANDGDTFDAALTERYRPGRDDRVATLPLAASPAPVNVAGILR